ncbi:MAG: M28 family peptidase [Anaerolineales bacterium]
MQRPASRLLLTLSVLAALTLLLWGLSTRPTESARFDGKRAYRDVQTQVNFGARVPGSEAHARTVDWIQSELGAAGWQAQVQQAEMLGHPIRNVVAERGSGRPWVILGAHYDSRARADRDPNPENRDLPVPGGNDGASGVAVLLELARTLPAESTGRVTLVFFDAEDQGDLPGWDWILGSRAFADALQGTPDAVIVVDMIGDADLQIFYERSSSAALRESIWDAAQTQGYGDIFKPQIRHHILDDHTPFLQKNLKAADLIDFDYPYWHTLEDTADKVSSASLQAVGDTLLYWLRQQGETWSLSTP